MFEEKITYQKDLNFYFIILTFQEKYDYVSFIKTKKNIQSKVKFTDFIKSLKNSKLLTETLCKNILEKSFLNNFSEFEDFIESCNEKLASFYIKFFYATILKTLKDPDSCIENFDNDYMKDVHIEYDKFFDKKPTPNSFYGFQNDYVYFVQSEIFNNAPSSKFTYISKPKSESNKSFINKETIEELLDGLDALTTDETSKDLLKALRKETLK